jgi:beta-lactam-binding protein with PASTA domain
VRRGVVVALAAMLCFGFGGSAGGERVAAPDVVGLDVLSAYDALHEAGLAVRIDEPVSVAFNFVASARDQSPAGGTPGRPGAPVALTLGTGPYGLLPPGGRVRVPRLIGKPFPKALETLRAVGLMWSAAPLPPLPASMRPTLLDNYRVTKQQPKAGTRFTQTVSRELGDGSVLTKTSTVWLAAEVETR